MKTRTLICFAIAAALSACGTEPSTTVLSEVRSTPPPGRGGCHPQRGCDWSGEDAGVEEPAADAGEDVAPADAGAETSQDAGAEATEDAAASETPTDPPATAQCLAAQRLWFEDFETGDYSRWTSRDYGDGWGDGCQSNGFSAEQTHSGSLSHRSEITCASSEPAHRGYGGVQFSGDTPLTAYTNSGTGTEAPYGIINTFWTRLDTPYGFGGGRWLSLWTVNGDCGWNERVVTLGLESPDGVLTPAHITNTGGTVTFAPDAPAFPLGRWVRVTVYVDYHEGRLHVWQDGQSVVSATFSRPSTDICQWHWGAYASGDNTDIVMFEDDKSIWRLEEPLSDLSVEPWLDACDGGATPTTDPATSDGSTSDGSTSDDSTSDGSMSDGSTTMAGLESLGRLPAEMAGLSWPEQPTIQREVTVSTAAQLTAEASVPGTRIRVVGATGGDVRVTADDVEILADGATSLGGLNIARGVSRVRVVGGAWTAIETAIPAQWYPTTEYRAEWIVTDVTVEGVRVNAPGYAVQPRGHRIAIVGSEVEAGRYSVWSGDMGPLQSQDIILFDNVFVSAGPEATVRLVQVLRSATIGNVLSNTFKHNYRVHGRSDLNYAASNLLVQTGAMMGTMPGDDVGRVWFVDNVFHHDAPDLFNPDPSIDALRATGNVAYTDQRSCFYCGAVQSGWTIDSNDVEPYQPAPGY